MNSATELSRHWLRRSHSLPCCPCSEKPKVMEMQSTRDTFETTCTFRIHNKPVNKMWEWTAVPSVPVTAKAMLPSTSAVTIELAHGVKMITFVNTVSGVWQYW